MQTLTQGVFKNDHQITIGVEFGAFIMQIDGKAVIKLQIWDTAGQEQFRSITKLFYKNSQAAIVVYDVTKRESFEDVGSWLEEIEENRDQDDMLVYLVGNRVDLAETADLR
jgi:small GTP-binding protein